MWISDSRKSVLIIQLGDENPPVAKTKEIYLTNQMMEEMSKNIAIHQKTRMMKTLEEQKIAMDNEGARFIGVLFLISSLL